MFLQAKELISIHAGIYFQTDKFKSKTNSEKFDAYSLLQDDSSNYFTAKNMEVDLNLDRIGMEMIELLGGLKHQTIDQLD